MKKATMNTILSLIANDNSAEAEAVREEINAELNRGAEKAQANRELYDAAKAVVMDTLSETPVTIAELFESCENDLPQGFTKSKLQYAVTRLWTDEIVKIEGKVNTYRKA